jgi:hypothetical protein
MKIKPNLVVAGILKLSPISQHSGGGTSRVTVINRFN